MEGPIADITEQVPVILVGLPANLTPFAFLALPASSDYR
jgi:hypothetical protein